MIPMLLVTAPIVGFFIGKQIDRWFHTTFWAWIMTAFGMVAGVREVITIIRRASEDAEQETSD